MSKLVPLSMIYNLKSGFHATENTEIYRQLEVFFKNYRFDVQSFELSGYFDFDQMMVKILERHEQSPLKGVIVAAGGDGTLNAVASKLLFTDIPLGILPFGTFNYVARLLNIPLDVMHAAQTIAKGHVREVHVAAINQNIYLNNASLGLYPLFIQKREVYNRYFGRLPFHAYTSGLSVLLRDYHALKLSITIDGKKYPVTTPLIFFGNNQLQLKDMHLRIAKCAAKGEVAGVVVADNRKWAVFKMLGQFIRGKLEQAEGVYSFCAENVIVTSKKSNLTVALDGEIRTLDSPLHIRVLKQALKVMVP